MQITELFYFIQDNVIHQVEFPPDPNQPVVHRLGACDQWYKLEDCELTKFDFENIEYFDNYAEIVKEYKRRFIESWSAK